jgi:hypothetical protein
MLSILATFFTCVQQRELGVVRTAPALRVWLSNGVRYHNASDRSVYQSSLAAQHLLDAPYEFLSVSIASFVAGMAAYLGSAWWNDVQLSPGATKFGDGVVTMHFIVATGFAFVLFPLLLGKKSSEAKEAKAMLRDFEQRQAGHVSDEAKLPQLHTV